MFQVAKVLWTCVLQDQRKFWSDSIHFAPPETAVHIAGKCHTGPGVALPGCGGGLSLGVGLADYRFLLCRYVHCVSKNQTATINMT